MSAKPEVASADVLESLPSVEEAIVYSMTWANNSLANNLVSLQNLCKRTRASVLPCMCSQSVSYTHLTLPTIYSV